MIAYVDSSVLVRAYLPDEKGHDQAVALLNDPDLAVITGTWARIEVSGALVRAARAGRGDRQRLLASADADFAPEGPVTVVSAPQAEVESRAFDLVIANGLRAMDAWHLATAELVAAQLMEPGEELGFASRDEVQVAVAASMGFRPL